MMIERERRSGGGGRERGRERGGGGGGGDNPTASVLVLSGSCISSVGSDMQCPTLDANMAT